MDIYSPKITGSLVISGSMYVDGTLNAPIILGAISASNQIDYAQIINRPESYDLVISSSNYPVSGNLDIRSSAEALNLDGYKIYANEFTHSLAPSKLTLYKLPDNSAGSLRLKSTYTDSSFYDYAWVYSSGSTVFYSKMEFNSATSSVSLSLDEGGNIVSITTGSNAVLLQSVIDVMTGSLSIENSEEVIGVEVQYLVVAGGGSGGSIDSGGGGAGGYRSSVFGEQSGGGSSTESPLILMRSTSYIVTVGGGGAVGVNGNNSIFHNIVSFGGGSGKSTNTTADGGSGGGGSWQINTGGLGTNGQGFNGGSGRVGTGNQCSGNVYGSGGGGGAGQVGQNAISTKSGNGGNGLQSSITGTATYYAGGGGGGADSYRRANSQGLGGLGGGGNGRISTTCGGSAASAQNGLPNIGGGGGGGDNFGSGASGGSGVVILRYPSTYTITNPGGGLTFDPPITVGSNKVTIFTAGTGNIQFQIA